MGAYRRGNERSRSSLRDVYVARTVVEPQKPLERTLNRIGRALGPTAIISTIGSIHLTFLESCGVTPHFRIQGYSPQDIKNFKVSLQQHLDEQISDVRRMKGNSVAINTEQPLRIMDGRNNVLALNVVPDEDLTTERDLIEGFLQQKFGELPNLRSFDTHISIGRICRQLTTAERADPTSLIPADIHIPREVALNGLTVYLGRIH